MTSHRPLNGYLALANAGLAAEEASKADSAPAAREGREEINPLGVYNMFKDLGYGNPDWRKQRRQEQDEMLALQQKYGKLFARGRLASLRRELEEHELNQGDGSWKGKLKHGYKSAGHWHGFPILDTLVRPFYALFKGANRTRESNAKYYTRLATETKNLQDYLASDGDTPAATPAETINVEIGRVGDESITLQVPKNPTPEYLEKHPYILPLIGSPFRFTPPPSAPAGGTS